MCLPILLFSSYNYRLHNLIHLIKYILLPRIMKHKHALTEESESIDMVVTSDDHATKEIMLDARFTSFL